MRVAVPKEIAADERRVALTPATVRRLVASRLEISVQHGAGAGAHHRDADYQAAGARIEPDTASLWRAADLIAKVRPPTGAELAHLRDGATVIALLNPLAEPDLVRHLAARRIDALALELVPRTSAAQAMDAVTSQASIAGYRAVVIAAEACARMFPMMMTAAGTIAPARVLVLGAGVAGLQAIATARRLGAVVEAFDVRKVVKDQVESLGARFIEVPSDDDGASAGGYAREVSAAYRDRQAALISQAVSRADVCITTAQIPGRAAPILVTEEQVAAMRRGSVIVDLAADHGGNCELTRAGHRVTSDGGVLVIGDRNLPAQVPVHASQVLARNLEALLAHLTRDGALAVDPADPITAAMLVCHGGAIVHPQVAAAVAATGKDLAA
jgi:H+-translocating NAD(P) transhydrogenase subunit alpha